MAENAKKLTSNDDISIPGYDLKKKLGEGANGVVYLAEKEGQSFAVKFLTSKTDQHNAIRDFRREAATLVRLKGEGVVSLIELQEQDEYRYMVMELVQGEPLTDYLAKNTLDSQELFRLTNNLAQLLEGIHNKGFIHGDLKPDNMIIQPNGTIKLIDMGMAVDVNQTNEKEVFGTVLYSPPEQLGVINAVVDARSDLYSLGVILFQAATARLPIDEIDVNAHLHALASFIPPQLTDFRSDIKPAFSELIRSLLFLDPDDRISSATCFLRNLSKLEDLNLKLSQGVAFKSAIAEATSSRFKHLGAMVGRKQELASLMQSWENAKTDNGSFNFIRAESGMGKSRLVSEFIGKLDNNQTPVFKTKCDEDKQSSFYAIRSILKKIFASSRLNSEQISASIKQLLADKSKGYLGLTSIVPAIKNFIEVSDENSNDISKEQLVIAAADLMLDLSSLLNMATLYIDDVQWMDSDSLDVLAALAPKIDKHPLMVVLTSRNEQVYQDSIASTLDSIQPGLKNSIELQPLSSDEIKILIDSQLGNFSADERIYPLLSEKSSSNPFVTLHYLNLLIDNGFLRPEDGEWIATVDDLSALQLPTNIADLLLSKIEGFEAEVVKVLSYAALLGTEFDVRVVEELSSDNKFVIQCINLAQSEGMVSAVNSDVYAFTHDKVREALLGVIASEDLPNKKQECADALLRKGVEDYETQCLLANFYIEGNQSDIEKIITHSESAGLMAFERFSYNEAVKYLSAVVDICSNNNQVVKNKVEKTLASGYDVLGQSDAAIQHYRNVLDRTDDKIERSILRRFIAQVYIAEYQVQLSYEELHLAFNEIDMNFPKSMSPLSVFKSLGIFIWANILNVLNIQYKIKNKDDARRLDAINELMHIAAFILFFVNMDLLVHPMLRMYYYAFKSTKVKPRVISIVMIGFVLRLLGLESLGSKFYERGHLLAETKGMPSDLALVDAFYVMVKYFTGQSPVAIKAFERHKDDIFQWTSPNDFLATYATVFYNHFFNGKFSDLSTTYQAMLRRFKGAEETTLYRYQIKNSYLHAIMAAEGNFSKLSELAVSNRFDYSQINEDSLLVSPIYAELLYAWMTKSLDMDFQGIYDEYAQIKAFQPTKAPYGFKYFYILKAYTLHMQLNLQDHKDAKLQAQYLSALKELKAASARPYLPEFRAHYHLLLGAYHRFNGDRDKAEVEYLAAEKLAHSEETRWVLLLVYEERAQLFDVDSEVYVMNMQIAQSIADKYNINHLTTIDGKRISKSQGSTSQSTMLNTMVGTMVESSSISDGKNSSYLKALLEVSLSSISVVEPEKIAQIVLKKIMSVIGAERAVIFLSNGVDVEATPVATHGQEEGEDILYSTTVLRRVIDTGETIIVGCSDDGELIGSESIAVQGIRSVICAPLKVQDEIYGAVYLDSRIVKGVFTASDIEILQAMANQVAISIVTAKTAQVEIEKKEFEKDMDLLSNVQQMLLPEESSFEKGGVQIKAFYQPAQSCGGDWWTQTPINEHEFSVMLGDVSGHGAASAMVTSIVSSTFSCLTKLEPDLSLHEKLAMTSAQLLEVSKKRYLMTMCTLEVNTKERTVKTIGAGSPQIILMKNSGEMEILDTLGTPLGLDDFKTTENEFKYEKGDRLFFFTDGIVEHKLPNGREVGFKKIYKMFEKTREQSLDESYQVFADFVKEACKHFPQDDDISYLMLEF